MPTALTDVTTCDPNIPPSSIVRFCVSSIPTCLSYWVASRHHCDGSPTTITGRNGYDPASSAMPLPILLYMVWARNPLLNWHAVQPTDYRPVLGTMFPRRYILPTTLPQPTAISYCIVMRSVCATSVSKPKTSASSRNSRT